MLLKKIIGGLFLIFFVYSQTCLALPAIPEKPSNWVTDLAEMLSTDEENQLNSQINDLEKKLTVEIGILTLKTLEGGDLEKFSVETFNKWGIGKADTKNGILIVIALEDREFRIEVGDGAEGAVTDYQARLVAEQNLIPAFRSQKYFDGLSFTVKELGLLLEKDPGMVSKYKTIEANAKNDESFSPFAVIVISLLIFYFSNKIFKTNKSNIIAKSASGSGLMLLSYFLSTVLAGIALSFFFSGFIILILGILRIFFHDSVDNFIENFFTHGRGGYFGGGGGSSFGGGFGGFGGGSSSGGGFSGSW